MKNPRQTIEWRFKPNSRDDKNIDPIQGEFFTTRDVGNIANALIREGIQNALDERIRTGRNQTVKVRVFLSGEKYAISSSKYMPFIDTLIPHLEAKNSGLDDLPDFKKPMKYIVFEDFNTNGLVGDPNEFYVDNIKDKKEHNFYYFWRNVGRSGKSDDQLGRWGLGKTVFPACSDINTFWGLTIRNSDKQKLLMGQCILRIHNRSDKKVECGYRPYGDFGKFTSDDFFVHPLNHKDYTTDEFQNLFRLKRNNDPGLSLVIPFYTEELTFNHLAYSVVEQYFYPILEGKLEVEIIEEDTVLKLTRDKIQTTINSIDFEELSNESSQIRSKESLVQLFNLANWTFELEDDDYFQLNPNDIYRKPRWNKSMFEDEEALSELRNKFDNGERIAFKIPLKFHPVGSKPKTCWYEAFLEKDLELQRPETLVVRDGITISGISLLDRGSVRGMVIIHDPSLARMLGDSENPAHTEWLADSRNFKGKYVDGSETIVFIKNTLKSLYEKLQKPLEGLQKDLLIDFFSIPVEAEDNVVQTQKTGGKTLSEKNKVPKPEIEIKQTRISAVLIDQITGGVRIYSNPKSEKMPESVRIKMGYDVPRGNPINNYQILDFDLSKSSKTPVQVESRGVNIIKQEKNELEFEISDQSDFEIILSGFDVKRDLFIKLI
jgi:hypothetical protein